MKLQILLFLEKETFYQATNEYKIQQWNYFKSWQEKKFPWMAGNMFSCLSTSTFFQIGKITHWHKKINCNEIADIILGKGALLSRHQWIKISRR